MSESDDRAEIIALIHANRIGIWTGNYDAWAECFVHSDYLIRWGYWAGGGTFFRQGWEDISRRARAHIGSELLPNNDYAYRTTVENLMLRISGDIAWASFEQQYPGSEFPDAIGPGRSREMRVFERHEGRWKIAFLGFSDNNAGRPGESLLIVDREGVVQWRSSAAAAMLEDDDDVVIRNRRLRLRDTAANRKLQTAIGWAARQDDGYMSRRGVVPIVLEQGEDIPARVFWVIARDGNILVSLGSQHLAEERLDAAAIAFGLSPAQRKLAGHVITGLALPDAAAAMEISINTARTHLNRIFEKTGVHNQVALVRMLLSVTAPL